MTGSPTATFTSIFLKQFSSCGESISDQNVPASQHTRPDASALRAWIIGYISEFLQMSSDDIPTDATFDSYGIDSVEAVVMASVIEEKYGLAIDPVHLFQYPSIDSLISCYIELGMIVSKEPRTRELASTCYAAV